MASFGGTYDSRIARAKRQIDDALGLPQRVSPLGPPPNQQQPPVRGQAGPMAQQMPAGAPNPGAPFGAPPMGAQQPMAARFAGMQAGVQGQAGPVSLGAQGQLGPRGGFQGVSGNASMPMAGGNVGVNAALDDEMKLRMLQARYQRGPVSVSGGYAPGAGFGGEMRYEDGPFAVSGGYDPARGANVSLGVRRQFQEGGLATSLRVDPTLREQDMEFVNTRNQHMRELTGKTPYAKGGGAWTRKEGKNPEGGLNAKGRASLKAQGQDIKPPVSAKQAKTSPKAAARRSSFCARMGGMEGPMKDDKGRPTRKALALRKWDC